MTDPLIQAHDSKIQVVKVKIGWIHKLKLHPLWQSTKRYHYNATAMISVWVILKEIMGWSQTNKESNKLYTLWYTWLTGANVTTWKWRWLSSSNFLAQSKISANARLTCCTDRSMFRIYGVLYQASQIKLALQDQQIVNNILSIVHDILLECSERSWIEGRIKERWMIVNLPGILRTNLHR